MFCYFIYHYEHINGFVNLYCRISYSTITGKLIKTNKLCFSFRFDNRLLLWILFRSPSITVFPRFCGRNSTLINLIFWLFTLLLDINFNYAEFHTFLLITKFLLHIWIDTRLYLKIVLFTRIIRYFVETAFKTLM